MYVFLSLYICINAPQNHHPQNHTVSSYFTFNLETSVFDLVVCTFDLIFLIFFLNVCI